MKLSNIITTSVVAASLFSTPALAVPFTIDSDIGLNFFGDTVIEANTTWGDFEVDLEVANGQTVTATETGPGSLSGETGPAPFANTSRSKTLTFGLAVSSLGETVSENVSIFWTVDDILSGSTYASQDDLDLVSPVDYVFSFGTLTLLQFDATVILSGLAGISGNAPLSITASYVGQDFEAGVPAPGTLALLGLGLIGLAASRRAV